MLHLLHGARDEILVAFPAPRGEFDDLSGRDLTEVVAVYGVMSGPKAFASFKS